MKNCGDSFYPVSVSYNKAQHNKERKEKGACEGRGRGREKDFTVLPFVCLCHGNSSAGAKSADRKSVV